MSGATRWPQGGTNHHAVFSRKRLGPNLKDGVWHVPECGALLNQLDLLCAENTPTLQLLFRVNHPRVLLGRLGTYQLETFSRQLSHIGRMFPFLFYRSSQGFVNGTICAAEGCFSHSSALPFRGAPLRHTSPIWPLTPFSFFEILTLVARLLLLITCLCAYNRCNSRLFFF